MKIKSFLYSKKTAPFVFVLPFIISLLVFWAYPLFSTVQMSFQSIQFGQTEWVGLANYQRLLRDTVFYKAVGNSVRYMLWTLALLIPFPMIFAAMMDSRIVKAKGLWKALMYMPALTSVVISGTLFRLLFAEMPTSQMNILMQWLGQSPLSWLKDDTLALVALLTLASWRWMGVNMLYYMAGLKNIDHDLYEAADIDGANAVQKFFRITLPLLKPTTIYVLTISVYAGLAMFLESYMLWSGNNSPMNMGLTIVGYLYRRGIERNEFGYASSVGLVLLVIALVINITQLVLNGTFKKEAK